MSRSGTRVLTSCLALSTAATLLAGCTAGADHADPAGPTPMPQVYRDDPAEIAQLEGAAGLQACPDLPASSGLAEQGRLPDLTLPCLGEGPAVNLAALGGVPYVVNVWAGWCEPCRDEMPQLQEVYEQAAGRVGVLGVDFQDTRVGGLSAAAEFGVTFPSVQDLDGETRAALRFVGMPFSLFVSADGDVIARHEGQIESADELRDLIATNLGVRL